MKWFKHDSDAYRDSKLRKVVIKYGMQGYGLYWYCIELISSGVDADNITFELEHDAEIISQDTGINYELVQEMMSYMIKLGLFENCDGVVTCMKLAKRIDKSMTSNPRMRNIIEEIRVSHDPIMTESENIMQDKIRLDKNRLDCSSDKSPTRTIKFIPPDLKEVTSYCKQRKNKINPQSFIDYYESCGWVVGKNKPMKCWQSTVRYWESNGINNSKEDDFAKDAI